MKNFWSKGSSFPHLPATKSAVASTKAQDSLPHIASWGLRCTSAFIELKWGNVCSQGEVGNNNIKTAAGLNVKGISGLQFFVAVNDVFISIFSISTDLFLPITGIFIAG